MFPFVLGLLYRVARIHVPPGCASTADDDARLYQVGNQQFGRIRWKCTGDIFHQDKWSHPFGKFRRVFFLALSLEGSFSEKCLEGSNFVFSF